MNHNPRGIVHGAARLVRTVGAALLLTALTALTAGAALAAPPTVVSRNFTFSFPTAIDTESCPGLTIEVDLEGVRNWTDFYDQDGELTRSVINVRYWFTFTNTADPSLVAKSPGFRHIELDYANDTFTESGIYRNATMRGEGNILQVAGRTVETLETAELLLATPHRVEILDDFCAALAG